MSDKLPAELALALVLCEYRLDKTSDQVDIAFTQDSSLGNKELLRTLTLPESAAGYEEWKKAQEFFRNMEPELWNCLRHFWLEFDAEHLVPSLFLTMPPSVPLVGTRYSLLLKLIEGLSSRNSIKPISRTIDAIFEKLGENAPIPIAGWMFPRNNDHIRLLISCQSTDDIATTLEKLGLQERADSAATVLEPFADLAEYFMLSIDIGEKISRRVGFEVYNFKRFEKPEAQRMLEVLVEQNLCTEEKKEALERWPGSEWLSASLEKWPEDLRKAYFASFASRQFLSFRHINHIKILLPPDNPPMAKAYLASGYGWKDGEKEPRPFTLTEMGSLYQ